jgi:hypothetical protein
MAFCCISNIGYSQEINLNKKEKKEAMEAERFKNFEELGLLLESRRFMFESTFEKGLDAVAKYPNHSVIKVDSSKLFINSEKPIFPNYISISPYSIEYNIVKWELSKNSNKQSYSIKMYAISELATDDRITMDLFADKSGIIKIQYLYYYGNVGPY